MKMSEERGNMLHGVLLIALFSCAAFYIGDFPWVKSLSFSPMIVGIVLGMLYANSLRNRLPATWVPGILFCSKRVLRLGIVLYGFRLTFQDVLAVGAPALLIDAVVVTVTICGGVLLGRLLKMDRGIALLTSVGSGICGAAAVLGAESTIRARPYKTAVAVSTVVIFGTISMFLYPVLYRHGIVSLTPEQMGIYTGATLHEVAHVVGAGNAMNGEISDAAIIVKMIRVMMLVPVLLTISYSISVARARRRRLADRRSCGGVTRRIAVPWFAFGFIGIICLNSLLQYLFGVESVREIPLNGAIEYADTFLLTMAMTALGTETSLDKFRQAGARPFVLAGLLYVWLVAGGYFVTKYVVGML